MVWKQTLSLILIIFIQTILCSGVFELRLKSFINEEGKDSLGHCCSGEKEGPCMGPCMTRFRVCLKHYQVQIDPTSACTYGDLMTPVLGQNNVHLTDDRSLNVPGFSNPIKFPFDFAWPGTFSLIVEAWHESNGTTTNNTNGSATEDTATSYGSGRTLINRLTTQKWLDITPEWTEDERNSTNSKIRYEYRVTCDEHYYGSGCANVCRPRDDNFGHYSCSPAGERICMNGWKGDYCTKPRCLSGCDDQHGHCVKPGECLCHPGWQGKLCDQCERYPGCLHGTCSKPWECLCDEGWGGLFCNQDLNYCTNRRPCRNGGTCFNSGQGSYTCECRPGYKGIDCERKKSNCTDDPCLNGATCKDNENGFQCTCLKGWYGSHCELAAQTCEAKPCFNGATCMDTIHGYKCVCQPGYTGPECQQAMKQCSPNPCVNSGICNAFPDNSGYKCNCPIGYEGKNCEINIDECKDNPCENGATCLDLINGYKCQCVPGYVGNRCQKEVNYCVAKPCANGGICENLVNDYKCKCRAGFTGKDCSVYSNECGSNPCANGGSCYNRENGFHCECTMGFRGPTCREEDQGIAGNISRHVSIIVPNEEESKKLTPENWSLIIIVSVTIPILVLIAAIFVTCAKQRRKNELKRADKEARMQNEQNIIHSSVTKRGDAHMIKNTWGQCVSKKGAAAAQDVGDPVGVGNTLCYPKAIDPTPVYTLERSRSQKQLNTDTTTILSSSSSILRHSFSNRLSKDIVDNNTRISSCINAVPPPLDNRISVMSINSTSHSNLSDISSSLSSSCKQYRCSQMLDNNNSHLHGNNNNNNNSNNNNCNSNSKDKSNSLNSSVYIIDEHYPSETLFATEV